MPSVTSASAAATGLSGVVAAVRAAVRQGGDWTRTARLVAGQLHLHLSHLLHAEPGGSFSVSAMVWLPGQVTPVHDHVTWCVFGVLQGAEQEELFELADGGRRLARAGSAQNTTGQVSGFAPPGDIHRVRNTGDGVTISLHVYGADISRLGSSIRREYALPIG
jgi:predicted metal-dependent enzyme (double-stranded beta helix superfamily)